MGVELGVKYTKKSLFFTDPILLDLRQRVNGLHEKFNFKLKQIDKKLKNPPTRVEMGWQNSAKKKPA